MGAATHTQDELKAMAARAALAYVEPGQVIGVGTGSTVNHFLDALAQSGLDVRGAVSSSEASSQRLRALGIAVHDSNAVADLSVYIDGADEIDGSGCMIKGGGAALTREKIVAALARRFICVADQSKQVQVLGRFALPVEVIPMAAAHIGRRFAAGVCGTSGRAVLREGPEGPLVTDNGQHLLDVHGLQITDPLAFEQTVNQWPGVVTVGVFAQHRASVCLLATQDGVQTLNFEAGPPSADC
ncbi:MAG: ribose-5-phosphate isomerase RpiA [Ottowia sp.]|nr:ribose-5-phosphate isomerase RpiA [Ottowia sp.]